MNDLKVPAKLLTVNDVWAQLERETPVVVELKGCKIAFRWAFLLPHTKSQIGAQFKWDGVMLPVNRYGIGWRSWTNMPSPEQAQNALWKHSTESEGS